MLNFNPNIESQLRTKHMARPMVGRSKKHASGEQMFILVAKVPSDLGDTYIKIRFFFDSIGQFASDFYR